MKQRRDSSQTDAPDPNRINRLEPNCVIVAAGLTTEIGIALAGAEVGEPAR